MAAINASPAASALVSASTYRGNAGNGVTVADSNSSPTSSMLPSPSRGPFTGAGDPDRQGPRRFADRCLAYSQEHAREWVTPLVAVETAERLLRNYRNDAATRQLVDDLDIFIIPSVNPDGGHYSFYDANFQRKNMTNYCAANNADPNRRNSWGVDLNRNFSVGSRFDGYDGASGSCTNELFSGQAGCPSRRLATRSGSPSSSTTSGSR